MKELLLFYQTIILVKYLLLTYNITVHLQRIVEKLDQSRRLEAYELKKDQVCVL